MEINKYPNGSQPVGALATEDLVEGRFVVLTSHTWDEDFGSLTDLPGVKYPTNATEAARARYAVTFTAPERRVSGSNPMYIEQPSFDYALRMGFDQSANVPFSATVELSWRGNRESATIPSGWKVLLLGDGSEVTIPSGQYVYSSDVETPGALLEVLNSGDDGANKGKLSYSASGTIAEVVEFNDDNADLTVRIIA